MAQNRPILRFRVGQDWLFARPVFPLWVGRGRVRRASLVSIQVLLEVNLEKLRHMRVKEDYL